MAMLNRDMAFGVMLRISVSSNSQRACLDRSVLFRLGATGLTISMVVMNVTTTVVAGLSARSWDHFIPSLQEWRQIISLGAHMSGVNVINQIAARAPDLVIGRVLGFASLGLYHQ
jgi:O-antigen/teichoic acid export membrane protein